MPTAERFPVLSASPRSRLSRVLGEASSLSEAATLIRKHVPAEICGAMLIGAELLSYPDLGGHTVYQPKWRDPAWIRW